MLWILPLNLYHAESQRRKPTAVTEPAASDGALVAGPVCVPGETCSSRRRPVYNGEAGGTAGCTDGAEAPWLTHSAGPGAEGWRQTVG